MTNSLIGVGVDVASVARIARACAQPGFERHVAGPEELDALPADGAARAESLARAFAVKEAVLKALGTGAWQGGTDLRDVRVASPDSPRPAVLLGGATARVAAAAGAGPIHVAVTRTDDRVLAVALWERTA